MFHPKTCGVRDEYDKRVAILEEEVAMLMKDLHKDHNAQQLAKQKMEEVLSTLVIHQGVDFFNVVPFNITFCGDPVPTSD